MERVQLGIDETRKSLPNLIIEAVEFVTGETEDDDVLILRLENNITVYATSPAVYANDSDL
jgi:hypothetical protein